MVAAEAAAAGCPPLVARHSGLAEVAAGLEAEYPPGSRTSRLRHRRRRRPRAKLAELLALAPGDGGDPRAAAPRRRRALELDGRRERLLEPLEADDDAIHVSSTTLSRYGRRADGPLRGAARDARERYEAAADFTLAVEEEFAILDPATLELVNRFEEVQAAAAARRSRRTSSAS